MNSKLFFANIIFLKKKKVHLAEAYKRCRYDWMREALNSFKNLLTGKPVSTVPELSESSSLWIVKPNAIALCWWFLATLNMPHFDEVVQHSTSYHRHLVKCLLCGVSIKCIASSCFRSIPHKSLINPMAVLENPCQFMCRVWSSRYPCYQIVLFSWRYMVEVSSMWWKDLV